MFDLGWTELLVIGVLALIIVGPKDLPVLFRNVGKFVGRARGMAREFSRAMNQAADDAGVSDVKAGFKAAADPLKTVAQGVRDTTTNLTNIDPDSHTGKLAAERAESAKKIRAANARAAADRMAKQAADAEQAAVKAEAALTEPEATASSPSDASKES